MRGLFLLTIGIFAFTSSARADDDVYVDMSVLNSLGSPVLNQEEPKFPIVKKTPAKKTVAKKATPKKEDVVVNKVETTPVVKVEVKEQPIQIPAKPEKIAESMTEATPVDANPLQDDVIKSEPEAEESVELRVISNIDDEEIKADIKDIEQAAEADAGETALEPLISDTVSSQEHKPENQRIFFLDDDVELTDAKKNLVDSIVATFANPAVNKIAIYSYNFDNGEDSFKKKRQSLNRAVEIRSYLLGKGYKNFSIKVINITDDESKKGIVEIEEIK